MQGTFKRDRAQVAGDEKLGVDADELVHATASKRVRDPVDPSDPAGGAVSAAPSFTTVVVYPPPQSFHLDGNLYIISHDASDVEDFDKSGYWVVPHVIADNSAGKKMGRPENVTDELHDDLKTLDWGNEFDDMDPEPDNAYARLHVDFERANTTDKKINVNYLKEVLDKAERSEYDFALRMQGLLNCGLNAVWTCTEFGFDNSDRGYIMEQFLQKYIGRFLSQVSQQQQDMDPDKIVREALQMHSRFCSGWTKEHKKGLSPTLDSCSEALVGHFCGGPLKFMIDAGMTRKEIARFLRRDENLSPQFGLCLHFFMVKMEQDKNGRNANYKSMFNATQSQLLQMKTLEMFLRQQSSYMQGIFAKDMRFEQYRRFCPRTMDWYYIVSQLHAPTVQYTGIKRGRVRMARNLPGAFFSQST